MERHLICPEFLRIGFLAAAPVNAPAEKSCSGKNTTSLPCLCSGATPQLDPVRSPSEKFVPTVTKDPTSDTLSPCISDSFPIETRFDMGLIGPSWRLIVFFSCTLSRFSKPIGDSFPRKSIRSEFESMEVMSARICSGSVHYLQQITVRRIVLACKIVMWGQTDSTQDFEVPSEALASLYARELTLGNEATFAALAPLCLLESDSPMDPRAAGGNSPFDGGGPSWRVLCATISVLWRGDTSQQCCAGMQQVSSVNNCGAAANPNHFMAFRTTRGAVDRYTLAFFGLRQSPRCLRLRCLISAQAMQVKSPL